MGTVQYVDTIVILYTTVVRHSVQAAVIYRMESKHLVIADVLLIHLLSER